MTDKQLLQKLWGCLSWTFTLICLIVGIYCLYKSW
jgi:hypothetical protein